MTCEISAVCNDLLPFAPKSGRSVSVSASNSCTCRCLRRPRSLIVGEVRNRRAEGAQARRAQRLQARRGSPSRSSTGCRSHPARPHVGRRPGPRRRRRPRRERGPPGRPACDQRPTTSGAGPPWSPTASTVRRGLRPSRTSARPKPPTSPGDLVQRVVELVHRSTATTKPNTRGPSCSSDLEPGIAETRAGPARLVALVPTLDRTIGAEHDERIVERLVRDPRTGLPARSPRDLTFLLGRGRPGPARPRWYGRDATPRPRGGCRDRDGAPLVGGLRGQALREGLLRRLSASSR